MKSTQKRTRRILLFLALLFSFFSWRILLRPGYFSMHDDMQAFRLMQMDKCFQDGQFPCRWIPDGGFGYGYPLFVYYPPFPFYLGEIIHVLGFSILDSVKITFIIGFLVSVVAMFLLGEVLWGAWGGFVASVFYTFAPYRALDVYARGALNEFWAFAWFSAIFYCLYRYVKKREKKYLLWFSFFYALLFLTHNLMVLIFTPVAIGWLLLNLLLEKEIKLSWHFILPSLLAIGMAAFFVLPVILEKKLVHVETMFMGYFNYLAHFVSLYQLFLDRSWGWGASVYGPEEKISFQIGILHWSLAFLVVYINFVVLVVLRSKRRPKDSDLKSKSISKKGIRALFIFSFGLFAAFLTHSRSTFIWKKLRFLEYLQFPWRFLSLVTFSFSLLAGGVVYLFRKLKNNNLTKRAQFRHSERSASWRRPRNPEHNQGRLKTKFASLFNLVGLLSLVLATSVIVLNYSYFRPEKWHWNLTDQEKFSDSQEWQEQVTSGIFDYLPKSAEYPPAEAAPETAWFEKGEGEIRNWQKGTDWLKFDLEVSSDQAQVRIPIFYFPEWTILVNEQDWDFDYQNKLGLPTFEVSKGKHQVVARLKNTRVRTLGSWLSVFSWLAWLLLILSLKVTKLGLSREK